MSIHFTTAPPKVCYENNYKPEPLSKEKAGSNDPDYMGFLSKGDRGVINYSNSSLFSLI